MELHPIVWPLQVWGTYWDPTNSPSLKSKAQEPERVRGRNENDLLSPLGTGSWLCKVKPFMEAVCLALGPEDINVVGCRDHYISCSLLHYAPVFIFLKFFGLLQVAAAEWEYKMTLLLIHKSLRGIKTLPDFFFQIWIQISNTDTKVLGLVGHCERDVNSTVQEQGEVKGLLQLPGEGTSSYLFWSSFLTWTWLTCAPTLLNCQGKHPVLQCSDHLITLQKSEPITNSVQIGFIAWCCLWMHSAGCVCCWQTNNYW